MRDEHQVSLLAVTASGCGLRRSETPAHECVTDGMAIGHA
jgi:hypothetical protein